MTRRIVGYSAALVALVLTPLVVPPIIHSHEVTATQLGQQVAPDPAFAIDAARRRAAPPCTMRGGVGLGAIGMTGGLHYAHCRDGSLVTWK